MEKIIHLEQELSALEINSSQLNESISNECNDSEKLLKEKAVQSTNLDTHLKEVDLLASKGDEIPTLRQQKEDEDKHSLQINKVQTEEHIIC